MINIFQAQRLALKKVTYSKGKSMFVIIPITLLFSIIVVAASEAVSMINVAHDSIFSPLASQNEVLELTKNQQQLPRFMQQEVADSSYTTTDNVLISSIDNVEKTSFINELPISLIQVEGLFTDNTVSVSSLAGLDPDFAALYTDQNFTCTEGEPIPIILNANDFIEVYEDWQGKSEISIDYTQASDPSKIDELSSQSPVKTRAIAYNRGDLLGKIITINFGGLDDIYTIKQETTPTGIKYVQKSADEITAEEDARKAAIEKYWDYDKITQPLTYQFKVVGISEGTDKSFTFIPSDFASKLMNSYVNNQIAARNGNPIPSDDQNSVYLGLVYDGVTVEKDSNSSIFAGIRRQVNAQIQEQFDDVNEQIESQNQQIARANAQNTNLQREFADSLERPQPGQGMGGGFRFPSMVHINSVSNLDAGKIKISYPGSSNTYTIPGLIYEQDRSSSEILGEYTAFDLTSGTIPLATNTILIKIDDIANREQVVSDLNEKGFNYQDFSQYKAYEQLESQLSVILNVASIIFMVISALFVLINMAKFVSEGKREIGIFRAIGATQGDIRTLFILQSLIYILLSIGFGLVSGYLVINLISGPMAGYAQELLNNITGGGITLTAGITAQSFLSFNAELILIYSAVLILVTLIVSLIPANQAAKISPVEAIRNA